MTCKFLTLSLIALFFLLPPAASNAVELKTAAQHSAPKYFTQADGAIGGLCIDIMQAIETTDPELRFLGHQDYLPFKRLQRQLNKGVLDVFFGFKKTAEREQKFVFLDKPLYQVNYVIAVRSEDNIKLKSLDDLLALGSEGALATVKGSAAARFLKNHGGLVVRDSVSSPTQLLKILMAGRIRFVFYHDLGLRSVIEEEGLTAKLKILPVSFSTYYHQVAFAKSTPAATIARVDAALGKISNNGRLGEIQRNYGLRAE